MSSPEERSAKALTAIAGYLKELIPIMATINENLVEFGKMAKASQEGEKVERRTWEPLRQRPAGEGPKKEGE